MPVLLVILTLIVWVGPAAAQDGQGRDRMPGDSPHSTGRTYVSPEGQQQQPQGPTGPIGTTTGGAPAESPQGQSPPPMQVAPEGSSKTIIDPAPQR